MVVKCINNEASPTHRLTVGKKYKVFSIGDYTYQIEDDVGDTICYKKERFIEVREIKNTPKENL